jgi:hypothetical protein
MTSADAIFEIVGFKFFYLSRIDIEP